MNGLSKRCGRAALESPWSHVVLTERGTLQPTRSPGELFARFTAQPKETEVDIAARVFALVRKLDTDKPLPHPSLLTVFRLYCIEVLSAQRIAVKNKCSKPTVIRRLKLLRSRIGVHGLNALEVLVKYFPVQKKQSVKRLILRRRRYVPSRNNSSPFEWRNA